MGFNDIDPGMISVQFCGMQGCGIYSVVVSLLSL